jgi:hypothetical protein
VKTFVSDFSPSFPPIEEYDSFWEEVDEFLAIDTIPFSEIDESYFDSEGDTLFLDNLLNDEPSIPPDKVKKQIEITIDDPLEHELEEFLSDYESFSFDTIEEISGNPTFRPDHSYPVYEAFQFHIDHTEETSSGDTTSLALISLPKYDSFCFDKTDCEFEKFSGELSYPEYEKFCFDLEIDHDPGGILKNESFYENFIPSLPPGKVFQNSFNDKIHNSTIMESSFYEDELFMIVIMTFFPFITYGVISLLRHSVGSEDIIFDPGIVSNSFHY